MTPEEIRKVAKHPNHSPDYVAGYRAGLEEAKNIALTKSGRWWREYKRGEEHRYDPHYQGMSDGADLVAQEIQDELDR